MAEIFIHEWKKNDMDGRRKLATKSKDKINSEHAYACDNLTTWFRLEKYIIKHDTANFLLDLIGEIGTDNVKTWEHNEQKDRWEYVYHVDDIVRVVNKHFSGNEYIALLSKLQEELLGYEVCYYICSCYRVPFNYKEFLADKDAYKAKLEAFSKKVNEKV